MKGFVPPENFHRNSSNILLNNLFSFLLTDFNEKERLLLCMIMY